MDALERLLIERACERLVIEYCHFVDHGEAAKIAGQFTEDGVWSSAESTVTGRAAMQRAFQRRQDNTARVSRHVCGNILIQVVDENTATGVVYLTLFRHDGEPGREISPTDVPALLGEYRDSFEKTADGWRFKRRDLVVNFLQPPKAET